MSRKPLMNEPESQIEPASIRVSAGLIRDAYGRILLGQRPADKHLGGTWEFPGGKCLAQESADRALARELREELGIRISRCEPLLALTHAYPDLTVRLILFEVSEFRGQPHGCEGQALRWAHTAELDSLDMPPADRPIVKALSLAPEYAITPDPARIGGSDAVLSWVLASLAAGHRLFQLRAHSLTLDELSVLGRRFDALVRARGGQWLLNGPAELALQLGADGVHLSSRALAQCGKRPLPVDRLVIASCHDRRELIQAGRIGADLVCLSPVKSTRSHPGDESLGWEGFEALCRHSPLPIFALGGLAPADLARARRHGAFGVAGISGFAGGE